jgi:hypothetical protein
MGNDKTGIILLSYNRSEVTARCIESLTRFGAGTFDCIIVDNASKDNSGQKLKALYPDIILLQNAKNLGFAGGNNVGIDYCIKNNYKYIMLINDDTIVDEFCLEKLNAFAMSVQEKRFVLTGKILCNSNRDIIWYAGGHFSFLRGIGVHYGFYKKDCDKYNISKKVTHVSGCMIFAPTLVFQTIGGLNEEMFAYVEDTDFSIRVMRAKIPIWYCPEAKIYHDSKTGQKVSEYGNLYLYLSTRNRVLIEAPIWYKIYLLMYTFLISLLKIGLIAISRRSRNKLARIVSILHGCLDALLYIVGRLTKVSKRSKYFDRFID